MIDPNGATSGAEGQEIGPGIVAGAWITGFRQRRSPAKTHIEPQATARTSSRPLAQRPKPKLLPSGALTRSESAVGPILSNTIRAAALVIAARQLGASEFGIYAGVVAMVGLAMLFGVLGTRDLMLHRVRRDRDEIPEAWGVLLATSLAAGVPVLVLTITLAMLLVPSADLTSVVLIGIAEFTAASLIRGPSVVWIALDRQVAVHTIAIGESVLRLLATLTLLAPGANLRILAVALVLMMLVGAAAVNISLLIQEGTPYLIWHEFVEGMRSRGKLSETNSGQLDADIDQLLIARAGLLSGAAIYAVAYGLVSLAMSSLRFAMPTERPSVLRGIGHRTRAATSHAETFVTRLAVASLASALVIFLVAQPTADLLGESYDGLVMAIIMLTPLPALRAIRMFFGHALSHTGNERFVARTYLHTFALHVLLALPSVAVFGWVGAIIANVMSECANLLVLWIGNQAVAHGRHRPPHLTAVSRSTELPLPSGARIRVHPGTTS